jgi:hypothetical protein
MPGVATRRALRAAVLAAAGLLAWPHAMPARAADPPAPAVVAMPLNQPEKVARDSDVHLAPAQDSPPVGRVRAGVEVVVVAAAADPDWIEVRLPDGRTLGYLPATAMLPAQAGAPQPSKPPQTIVGHPIVRDTATLVLGRRDIHLFGVLGEGGELADGLQSFITASGGTVTCAPQDAHFYVCMLPGNVDVAMAALLNGAARVTVDAPDLYRGQQEQAQRKKIGIWATN